MRLEWWKYLGIAILLYTLLFGMLVPLGPGIVEVSPSQTNTGPGQEFEVWGYNTRFSQFEKLNVVLKLDDNHCVLAREYQVISDYRLKAIFDLPALPEGARSSEFATLIIYPAGTGTAILPSAVSMKEGYGDSSGAWVPESQFAFDRNTSLHFPYRNILMESIRNTYFHVALWFAMMFILGASMVYSIRYLRSGLLDWDLKANAYAQVGILIGCLGITTGMIWAANTWGKAWSWDIKQTMAAVAMLIYLAYFVLRSSIEDQEKRARTGAAYNIFAFATLIPLLYVVPRLVDSLHPGSGGNPAMGGEDLDNTMRLVFYPAIIGWTLLGTWVAQLTFRYLKILYLMRSRNLTEQ